MSDMTPMKSTETIVSFLEYCMDHPEERFWQALRNWSGYNCILVAESRQLNTTDTFYWEGRNEINTGHSTVKLAERQDPQKRSTE